MSSPLPTAAEILQRFYDAETIYMAAAPKDRDFANGMGKHLCKDMKLVQSPDLPYGGTYEGHVGFQQWTEAMASYFDRLDVTDPQLFEQSGSDTIIVKSFLKLRVRKTGELYDSA
ncbi:Putative NTF2-like domain superfamily protein [Septoria linicola]|uniref:NTF2-like domain superfamily protein n=1 Tax=Septoria linicola TaxID=215465 RepID=A0A9Q9AW16_9PEZI|nr:Putative NTF2-like domain superfamily protein [Septoria linicola]